MICKICGEEHEDWDMVGDICSSCASILSTPDSMDMLK